MEMLLVSVFKELRAAGIDFKRAEPDEILRAYHEVYICWVRA